MRRLLLLLFVLSGCREDFAIADPDAALADAREADVGLDAMVAEDALTLQDVVVMDAAATDSALAGDASGDVVGITDVGVDSARPADSIRLAAHQLRLLDGFYEMNVLVAVLSGPPVATAPERFFLRFDGGAEVPGIPFDRPAANALCSESLRVTDSRGLLCRVSFPAASGFGEPVELIFTPEGTRVTAPVATCSDAAIIGRCDEGFLCLAGDCLPACSAGAPDGWCFLQESCDAGTCVADCSDFSPDGYCRTGTCVDGGCEP
ncbi:MAG: hypothetical protein AB8H86_18445 [Polyangiales bacterium]